jgi:DNA-binding transcriptional MerR regulator
MTGISLATLRAWERRYDFPESKRTSGGHRLYSEHDVMRLRWVKARIDEGMQTAQSITALRHQESTGHLVLTEQVFNPGYSRPSEQLLTLDTRLDEIKPVLPLLTHRLIDALSHRDTQAADEIMSEATAATTPEELIISLIAPSLNYFGQLWESGQVSVATEHLATNYLRQRLLMWMLSGPPPQPWPQIVLTCAPSEWHEGSLLILGALLRRRRWPVVYLGQAVPLLDLANFVRDLRPGLVVAVAMTEATALELAEWPRHLPEANQAGRPIVGYGGRVFVEQPEMRLKVPGIYLGNSFTEGVTTIERLLL